MRTLPALGSVNAYSIERATLNGQSFRYNGTTLGLTLSALAAGARVGDLVTTHVLGPREYRITPQGGGDRTPGGVWASRV